MNPSLRKALNHLTGQDNLESVSVKFLENLITKYPYFPVAHVLLTKKLIATKDADCLPQTQKTALYFSNPHWLHYQLTSETVNEMVVNRNGSSKNHDQNLPEVAISDDEVQVIPDQFHPEPEIIVEEIESSDVIEPVKQEGSEMPDSEADASPELSTNPNITSGIENAGEDNLSRDVPKPVSISEEEMVEDEKLLHEIARPEATTAIETHPEPDEVNNKDHFLEEKVVQALESHQAFSEDIEARTHALVNPPDPSGPENHVAYEPYHTIDYFASQGIQLVLENNPQDKLGKQLKSFTQWLKRMKKLGPEDALNSVKDTHLDNAIQDIADTSNTPRDIVTETMATVLEKQGKTDKAIELYTKLSFLNPDKSAYFADKIHNLKGN